MDDAKARLRSQCRARRRRRHARGGADDGEALAGRFMALLESLGGRAGAAKIVSGYWPIRDEIDPRPLLARLAARGHPLALPVVVGRDAPLIFRAWAPGAPLVAGVFATSAPSPDSPELSPEIVIAPLLAFDRAGHRLGYGGGYYDRSLAELRARGPVLAMGAAYQDQEVAEVPHGPGDQPLDWVVTEEAALCTQ